MTTPTLAALRRRFPEWIIAQFTKRPNNQISAIRVNPTRNMSICLGSAAQQRRILQAALEAWEREKGK